MPPRKPSPKSQGALTPAQRQRIKNARATIAPEALTGGGTLKKRLARAEASLPKAQARRLAKEGRKYTAKAKPSAAKRVVNIVARAGTTKSEGRGVLAEVRATGRGQGNKKPFPKANSSTNRQDVYRAGRLVRKESGVKASMRFNKAVAKVESNQAKRKAANPMVPGLKKGQKVSVATRSAGYKGRTST